MAAFFVCMKRTYTSLNQTTEKKGDGNSQRGRLNTPELYMYSTYVCMYCTYNTPYIDPLKTRDRVCETRPRVNEPEKTEDRERKIPAFDESDFVSWPHPAHYTYVCTYVHTYMYTYILIAEGKEINQWKDRAMTMYCT